MRAEILNTGSNLVRVGVRAAWGIVLPGILAIEEFGAYTLLLGAAQIASTVALLGSTNAALSGTIPLRPLLLHTLVLGAVLAAGLALLAPDPGTTYLIVAVQVLSLHTLLSAWARGRGRFGALLTSYLIGYLGFAAAAVATISLLPRLTAIDALWLELAAPVIALAALLVLARPKRSEAQPAPAPMRWKQVLIPVYGIGGLVLIDIIIWRRIEIFFLQASPSGTEGVAVFGLAIQLAMTALLLPAAVLEAWYPDFAAAWGRADFEELLRRRLRHYRLLYGFVALGALVAFALAIPVVYDDYARWTGLIVLLIALRLGAGYFGFHSTVLYATRRELVLYAPVIAGAIAALAAHGLLTLRGGLATLPYAYAFAHGVTAIGTWWVFHRRSPDDRGGDAAVVPHPDAPSDLGLAEVRE